ncbi:MAG TPA: 5'-methylthioadenosine/adenosylhomocysteine nucleosidase [Cyclobacteriaceae bacterium]|nr:5'-methylthioadenosine/adenosylhomocysteine nucleosidase [Cyclobacteriaceae bacterium]
MRLFAALFILITTTGFSQAIVTPKDAPPFQREFRSITGILGAFDEEVRYLLSITANKTESSIQRISFTQGEINGKKVVIAQTGIGKVNAAIVTQLMIEHFMPAEIIFTGIAGGLNPGLAPGDLVIGTKVAYHDYGTLTPDSLMRRPTRNPFTLKDNPVFYNCDPRLIDVAVLAAAEAKFEKLGKRYPTAIKGVIVTGDVFVASDKAVKDLRKKLNADATEMEGAAVAQVCLQLEQPFVVVRSLSDNAGNAASGDVKQFYKLAAMNSASLVIAMVSMIR